MKKSSIVMGALLFVCLLPTESISQDASSDSVQVWLPSPRGAMLRSAMLPGWGQAYNRKWLKALLVFGVEGGIAANAVYQNHLAVSSNTAEERAFYKDNRGLSVWWFFGIYLLNILDAYVDAQLFTFDAGPQLASMGDMRTFTFRFQIALN